MILLKYDFNCPSLTDITDIIELEAGDEIYDVSTHTINYISFKVSKLKGTCKESKIYIAPYNFVVDDPLIVKEITEINESIKRFTELKKAILMI